MRIGMYSTAIVVVCAIAMTCIVGCVENDDKGQDPSESVQLALPAFALDYDALDQPQILKSELFLDYVSITRYHIGQDQPIEYSAQEMSKIVLRNIVHPDTREWMLDQIDVHFSDGSLKSEHPVKVWNVDFRLSAGKGSRPVRIEQHFSLK